MTGFVLGKLLIPKNAAATLLSPMLSVLVVPVLRKPNINNSIPYRMNAAQFANAISTNCRLTIAIPRDKSVDCCVGNVISCWVILMTIHLYCVQQPIIFSQSKALLAQCKLPGHILLWPTLSIDFAIPKRHVGVRWANRLNTNQKLAKTVLEYLQGQPHF